MTVGARYSSTRRTPSAPSGGRDSRRRPSRHRRDRSLAVRPGRGGQARPQARDRDLPDWPRTASCGRARRRLPGCRPRQPAEGHASSGPTRRLSLFSTPTRFATPEATRRALGRVCDWWVGDGSRGLPAVGRRGSARQRVPRSDGRAPPPAPPRPRGRPAHLLGARRPAAGRSTSAVQRRAEVVGPAGSGKTMLARREGAPARARGLPDAARLLQPAAGDGVLREVEARGEPPARPRGLDLPPAVRDARDAGRHPAAPKPAEADPQEWWDETLPTALDARDRRAPGRPVSRDRGRRGPGLRARLARVAVPACSTTPTTTSCGCSTTPGRRCTATTWSRARPLERLELFEDYRSPAPVSRLAARSTAARPSRSRSRRAESRDRRGRSLARRPSRRSARAPPAPGRRGRPRHGRSSCYRASRPSRATSGASGGSVTSCCGTGHRRRRPIAGPAGRRGARRADRRRSSCSRRSAASRASSAPVVILCELPESADRLDQLLYVGVTRATTQLVVIAPPKLAQRLGRIPS